MVFHGTVQNGVVVFTTGISLPDGTPVSVAPIVSTKIDESCEDDIDPYLSVG
jgi:hypothetical protein